MKSTTRAFQRYEEHNKSFPTIWRAQQEAPLFGRLQCETQNKQRTILHWWIWVWCYWEHIGNFMGTLQNHENWCLPPQGIDYDAIKFVIHFATWFLSIVMKIALGKREESPSRWSFKGIIHPYIHPANNHSVCINQSINQSLWFICPYRWRSAFHSFIDEEEVHSIRS